MAYIADLHTHSRFSRACSPQLNIPNLVQWAKLKGIDVLGTSDFLHPLWFAELKKDLKEENGFLVHGNSGIKFVLSVEVASIYTHKGKGRRVHNVILMSSFASAEKFQKKLLEKRANISSDGRPIVGISSRNLLALTLEIDEKSLFIPAHCVLPSTLVHTVEGMKEVQDIKVSELVYTHENRKREVTEVLKHNHKGKLYKIQPWYFSQGLEATEEHPFLAFKVDYCPSTGDRCLPTESHKRVCQHHLFESYQHQWINAKELEVGDMLIFPRFTNTTPRPTLALDQMLPYNAMGEFIHTGGSRGHIFNNNIDINEDFCRLVGYYLAEGSLSITKGHISFAFNQSELDYLEDVKKLIDRVFGIKHVRIYRRLSNKGVEIIISSKLISELFVKLFYVGFYHRAPNKTLPDWMLHLPTNLQSQILLGWWRGDHGYTTSRQLMNQMKVICLRLGIIPSIGVDKAENHLNRGNHKYRDRIIKASIDLFHFSNLAFFEDNYGLLKDPAFKDNIRKLQRKHGWIDKDYIYLPIRKISTREYEGEVFNLEVDEDNSYITEFAAVHNCWTPWFGVFGSESGYDSLQDCFEDLTPYVYGIETGLSSDPAMNWRVGELDNKSIVSFSDAHSLPNLGRESTIIDADINLGYSGLYESIKHQKIKGTIEFYPEEGKYHYTGHRNCNIKYSPEDTKQKGSICPVCHKGLTVGVMERVEALATRSSVEIGVIREEGVIKSSTLNRPGYRMLVPLMQVIAEALEATTSSQKVINEYKKLTLNLGGEIKVLTKTDLADIAKLSGERVAEGVSKDRTGDLVIDPGYDGVYGVVKIWKDAETSDKKGRTQVPQLGLFD